MNVLLVGSGGREHALAWKAAQSPRLKHLWIAPGNAGTAAVAATAGDASTAGDAAVPRLYGNGLPVENVPIQAGDAPALTAFARANKVDLAIVGPEGPLAAGLADTLRAEGIRVFGPSAAAAQIEASKAFAKAFMARHGLPTARYAVCDSYETARVYLRSADFPVVIKASGLAAGKGVILPESNAKAEDVLRRILLQGEFGAAGDQVVIEERLAGPEVSLLAFSDGVTVRPMPPAQDHKNLLDGDRGPNTGGMGAYAPAPICPPDMVEELTRRLLQPAVDGLRQEHRPFIGVLYAGLMLTGDGPRLLEFNCRFGDPETQAILPLLDTDLLEIAYACAEGGLADLEIHWKPGAAACVVMASEGYPGPSPIGRPIHGLDGSFESAIVFHAGTKLADGAADGAAEGGVVTAGGRVLGVTGWGKELPAALANAYAAVEQIHFEGQHYRRDIGHHALETQP